MKIQVKLVSVIMAFLVLFGAISIYNPSIDGCVLLPETLAYSNTEPLNINIGDENVPLGATTTKYTIPVPVASGTQVSANQKATIDFSNARDGYVMVRFMKSTTQQLRVRITGSSGVIYQYRLSQSGSWEVFPLSDGNGKYTVTVWEQTSGNNFAQANTSTFTVSLTDEFAPFLRPNQFVNFNSNSRVVSKAAELTKDLSDLYPRVEAIYNYVIKNITYDKVFASEVTQGKHSGYVPDVDAVLAKGKGICFDYAAVMSAMLRSLGIPTRLVTGYTGNQFHAWIDVFSETDGWINNIIQFDGHKWNLMDPTFASTGNQSADVMRFIGDGKNYAPRFHY